MKKFDKKTPEWMKNLIKEGYTPFIITSRDSLPTFNLMPFGTTLRTFVFENTANDPFCHAYLAANGAAFGGKEYKMPGWVATDCVYLPAAVIGFAKNKAAVSERLVTKLMEDDKYPSIQSQLKLIPISGQVDIPSHKGYTNCSLFSLGAMYENTQGLSMATKALALETLRLRHKKTLYKIVTQYDNAAFKTHCRISPDVQIDKAINSTHPGDDMTVVLRLEKLNIPDDLNFVRPEAEPDFWLNATDRQKKEEMQKKIEKGDTFSVLPPYQKKIVVDGKDQWLLPIRHNPKRKTIRASKNNA